MPTEAAFAYLDDVIVHSGSPEVHLENLEKVLRAHWNAGLKLQPHKTLLMRKEALYLGHLIDEQGIRPDPSKTKIISEWPESRTITQLQSFLGLCNYYRGFVPQFSHIALPLTRYLEGSPAKNSPIKFDDAAKKAFAELKEKLVTAPILAYPNFEKDAPPFILDTDWVSLPHEGAPEN